MSLSLYGITAPSGIVPLADSSHAMWYQTNREAVQNALLHFAAYARICATNAEVDSSKDKWLALNHSLSTLPHCSSSTKKSSYILLEEAVTTILQTVLKSDAERIAHVMILQIYILALDENPHVVPYSSDEMLNAQAAIIKVSPFFQALFAIIFDPTLKEPTDTDRK